ncbi:MAG: molybdopterin-dependent oxidoreductase [Roseovarius sp.]|nr:molybdopterin-dependent oxidoreductase [Roseovarius sp.]
MAFTASHWGAYELDGSGGIRPLPDDPAPSRIGRGWVSAARDAPSRIMAPVARKGWLAGDAGGKRGDDGYVELDWSEAFKLVAREIERVRKEHGNDAIFGGSYGWASAGRFHHAQSQLRRLLNLAGGHVGSRETYSHAAAEVLFPHVIGLTNRAFQDQMTSLDLVAEHCDYLLSLGGISERTAQIASSGVARHDVGGALRRLNARGAEVLNVSPRGTDLNGGTWLPVRPGADAALLLALTYEVAMAGAANEDFLARYTSGWPEWRSYLEGRSDGIAKSADWAAGLCDIPSDQIREMSRNLVQKRSMIAVNWGLQRADHGEQVLWAALGLACVVGQIGRPGTGFAFGYGSTAHVGRATRVIDWPSVPQGRNPISDFIPVSRIADMLLCPGAAYRYNGEVRRYPDIRLIYWCGGNPFHHHQDLNRLNAAWKRPETIIVQDHSWTATARRADIVLPATSPLERADLMMNRRDPSLFYMSPVLDAPGRARDDFDIFRGIAAAMGLEEAFTGGRDAGGWIRTLWENAREVARAAGFSLPDFARFAEVGRFDVPDAKEVRIAFEAFMENPEGAPLATETGKITLHNETLASLELASCPGHPCWIEPIESLLSAKPNELHLISGQPDTRLHGQNDRGPEALADKINGREAACLNPHAAARRGLAEGDVIRIWNSRGACLAGLRFDPLLRPDCIALPTGAWFDPQIIDGEALDVHGNPNVLTIDQGCSELSQGNIAHTALVRVEKWTRALPPLTVDRPPDIQRKVEV